MKLGLASNLQNEVESIEPIWNIFKDVVSQWLVVDSGSTDGTQQKLREVVGDKLILVEEDMLRAQGYGYARTKLIELSTNVDYVLIWDGDERLLPEDIKVLQTLICNNPTEDLIWLPRVDYCDWDMKKAIYFERYDGPRFQIDGDQWEFIISKFPDWQPRLIKRTIVDNKSKVFFDRPIHEVPRGLESEVFDLKKPVIRHFNHAKSQQKKILTAKLCEDIQKNNPTALPYSLIEDFYVCPEQTSSDGKLTTVDSENKVRLCLASNFYNEIDNIEPIWNLYKDVVDKWLVVDSGSTDGTQVRLKSLVGDKLQLIEDDMIRTKGYGYARSKLIELNTEADWVLIVDGDERMLPEDILKLKKIVNSDPPFDLIYLPRCHYQKWDMSVVEYGSMTHTGNDSNAALRINPDWQPRLIKRTMINGVCKVRFIRPTHEIPDPNGIRMLRDINSPVIRHFGWMKTPERIKMIADLCVELEKNNKMPKVIKNDWVRLNKTGIF